MSHLLYTTATILNTDFLITSWGFLLFVGIIFEYIIVTHKWSLWRKFLQIKKQV